MAIISTIPTKSNTGVVERSNKESYSSPLVNYVEKVRIDNIDYTKIYTEVDSNLSVGDRVYIVNGVYDSYDIISYNTYRKGSNGYRILEIDRCGIVLDIIYTGNTPWDEDIFDNYIKIYPTKDILYEVNSNGYYPYKYNYGYRACNNILYNINNNKFLVADPYNNISDINNWTDITTPFLSNNFPILNGNSFTQNNGKLIIMETFTHLGKIFEKGNIYLFDNNINEWAIDKKSIKAYLSKGSFRDGIFINGNWNDGIFGQLDKKISWLPSGTWRNGCIFNSIFNGILGSKSDTISKQSYYAILENNTINQITDFNNNSGFGYNFADNNRFDNILIENLNATNCIFGSYSATQSLTNRYLNNNSDFGFDTKILNGNYLSSYIENTSIGGGLYNNCDIWNSKSVGGRFMDNYLNYSVIDGDIEFGNIKIIGYNQFILNSEQVFDNPYSISTTSPTASIIINHKFYISEDSYRSIKSGDDIHINNIVTTNPDILNVFDNNFILKTDINGNAYLSDNYGDKIPVHIGLYSKQQNSFTRTINDNIVSENTADMNASIDIFMITTSTFSQYDLLDPNITQLVTEFEDSNIQLSKINKTLITGGTFKNSVTNNPDYIISRLGTSSEYLSMTFSSGNLIVDLDSFSNIDYSNIININDIVNIDNITYDNGQILDVDGTYLIATYSQNPLQLVLSDFGSQSIAGSYSSGGKFISSFIVDSLTYSTNDTQDVFNSVHLETFSNTKIIEGNLKRVYMESVTIDNTDFIIDTNLDNKNINKLSFSEILLDNTNNMTIKSGFFNRSLLKDITWTDGVIYKSVLKNLTINNGVVNKSKWINGLFIDGILMDTKKDIISDISTNYNFTNKSSYSEWINGTFSGGEFFDSIWDNGEFTGGKFYNSIFSSGTWFDGNFGDIRYNNEDTKFGHPLYSHTQVNINNNPVPKWMNGTFINGEFGLKSTISGLPSPTLATMSWISGTFVDGIIQSYTSSSPTIWVDGTFNNGDIIGYVKWLDGTFNQGKFRSAWGDGFGTESSNYAWENGIFNAGRFGNETGLISAPIETGITYSNPSWFNGRFNDGTFYGKVWNSGIFTGGKFVGNSISSYTPYKYERWTPTILNIPNPKIFETVFLFTGDLGEWKLNILANTVSPPTPPDFTYIGRVKQIASQNSLSPPYSIEMVKNTFTFGVLTGGTLTINSDKLSRVVSEETESIEISYYSYMQGYNTTTSWGLVMTVTGIDDNGVPFSYGINGLIIANSLPLVGPAPLVVTEGIYKFTPTNPIPANSRVEFKLSTQFRIGILGNPGLLQQASFVIDDIKFNKNEFVKTAKIPDQFVMDYSTESTTPYYGLWRNGQVISDNAVEVSKSKFIKLSKLESVRRFKGDTSSKILFENALWVDGTFDAFGDMNNCIFLNGSFKNGNFLNSNFNPYVPRWDFGLTGGGSGTSSNSGYYSYELDNCIWISGYLDNSDFSISEWLGGVFNSGNMYGSHFKQGVSNYMNAYNCIWSGGKWKNGNWYGSDFDKNILFKETITFTNQQLLDIKVNKISDIITKQASRLVSDELFVWNLFDNTTSVTAYSNNLPYTYETLSVINTGVVSNNDFITIGTISNINTLNTGNSSPLDNRKLDLNFTNLPRGYSASTTLTFANPTQWVRDGISDSGASVKSKWGNGMFISGIWENGVWNNGVRIDGSFNTNSVNQIMDSISNFFQISPDRWRIELTTSSDITNFNIGDYISIGNIIGLTVNEERKFIKDSYQIIAINKITGTISVVIKTSFPLRSIEIDSDGHKIYITKNVWENGIFHSGRFDGTFNNGIINGYPDITMVENTYMIDGTIDGGRFYATQSLDISGNTYSTGLIQNATIIANNSKLSNSYTTWIDTNYSDQYNDYIWTRDNLLPPAKQPTSSDILSTTTNIWLGATTSNSRALESLQLGLKFKQFTELIDDDLNEIFNPERLENRGWSFSLFNPITSAITILPATQSKFVGNSGNQPTNNIEINTTLAPYAFPSDGIYYIYNDKLEYDKYRYFELSYDITTKLNQSGIDSFIDPYPLDAPFLGGDSSKFKISTVKGYHWNKTKGTPIIALGLTVVGSIDNIKFTELNYIPFGNYLNSSNVIDHSIKLPNSSVSDEIVFSERDSKFIDK